MDAVSLNTHLENGGAILVSTYWRSTIYSKKHVGWFTENSKGELYVRQGKGKVCLGPKDRPIVSIRLGKFQERAE